MRLCVSPAVSSAQERFLVEGQSLLPEPSMLSAQSSFVSFEMHMLAEALTTATSQSLQRCAELCQCTSFAEKNVWRAALR